MRVVKTRLDLQKSDTKSNVYLLGTWCIKNNLFENIKSYKIFPYHWSDKDKFIKDYAYLDQIYEKKLLECANILNRIHKTNKDLRYWRIVIGPWLRFFIDSLFDRYECVRLSHEEDRSSFFTIFSYKCNPPKDFEEFYEELVSDYWNEVIFSECVKHQGLPHTISKNLLVPEKVFSKEKISLKSVVNKSLIFYQSLISKLNN
jgi:putative transferase (TIGR04331 family)